jgi:squalene-hopene/tetraprenyl-beta-curcumene cyclase
MKRSLLTGMLTALVFVNVSAADPAPRPIILSDTSFKNEVQRAIDRGLDWLKADQNTNGWWSTPDHPALTALPIMAFKGDPSKRLQQADFLKKAYAHILKSAKPNGAIYTTNLPTYNTSLAMLALVAANDRAYDPVLRKARAFLVGLQTDLGEKGKADDVFDGGIGYGTKYEHSDMGNTLQALEALYHTRHLADDSSVGAKDLNWAAAIHFLQNCQNLSSHNRQQWVSDDPKNKGGFVYYPGHSMAGGETNTATGRVALRSYGSISYGGLLSYIYADLKRDDPRVSAVEDWLRRNYTLEENPGMGPQGLYYYFHTQAKALTALGVKDFELADGRKVNWRRQLASRLMDLQKRDGSWANDNSRWWEKDPVLVTSYAILALELVQRGL